MPKRQWRRWYWGAGAVGALVIFALVWFQPQKLFIDHNVDDTIPVAAAVPSASAPVRAEPIELARGRFVSRDHGTTGVARLLELADTRRIVRLEGLDTSNGPDLYLYLTTNAAGGAEAAFDDDFVSLGRLKGNQGDQNYDVPVDVDLSRFASVVIWCDRFNSAFGAAPLVR